jgi:hypothetical protein
MTNLEKPPATDPPSTWLFTCPSCFVVWAIPFTGKEPTTPREPCPVCKAEPIKAGF